MFRTPLRSRTARALSLACLASGSLACAGADPAPTPPRPTSSATSSATAVATVEPPALPPETSPIALETLLDVRRAFAPVALDKGRFAYLGDDTGTAQLTLGTLEGDVARAKPLTSFPDRVAAARSSKGGRYVVLLKDEGGDENHQLWLVDLVGEGKPPKGPSAPRALTEPGPKKTKHTLPVFDERGESIAFTSNRRNGKDMDLWVAKVPKGEGAKVGEGAPTLELSGSHSVLDFRAGKVLYAEERSGLDQDLWVYDVAKKKATLLTKHTGDERWEAARFASDGKTVLATTDRGRDFMGLVALDLGSGKVRPLVSDSFDVEHAVVCPVPRSTGGKKADKALPKGAADVVVYAQNERGVEQLYTLVLDGKQVEQKRAQLPARGVLSGLDCGEGGTEAWASLESAGAPPGVYALDLGASTAKRVTPVDLRGADAGTLVGEELISLAASDGVPLTFFWFSKKAEASRKRPVVMWVHGGPEAQFKPGWSPVLQYLALSGYAVAAPNVRGSTGYGKAFTHLDDVAKREDSVRDLAEITRFVGARPDVDARRIAVLGGSYGGYMVLASLTLYPELYAAGVDIVGIANFRSFLERTAPYRRALREAEYGSLAKDGALLDKLSPIHKVDRIQAPLMVIHGKNDPRVPLFEAEQIARALEARKLPVELMVFADEGHGLAKRENRLKAYPAVVRFLDTHVRTKKR